MIQVLGKVAFGLSWRTTWSALIATLMVAQLLFIVVLSFRVKESCFSPCILETKSYREKLTPEKRVVEPIRMETVAKVSSEKLAVEKLPLTLNPPFWPPIENERFPDFELFNQNGEKTRLSDLKGNIIIVQPVAMSCPVSQSFSGANSKGAFELCFPNPRIREFTRMVKESTGIEIDREHSGIALVQLLLFDKRDEVPSIEDARRWAEHFDLRTVNNQYVLVANERMINKRSELLIPGFLLIDRTFILRSQSTGPLPKRDLYNHLLPSLRALIPLS